MPTKRILSLAKRAALNSTTQWKVGAVVYRGSRILGVGTNDMVRTAPQSPHPYKTRHAEFNALGDVEQAEWRSASIYVHRVGRDGKTHNSRPCQFCAKMLALAELRRIEWSEDEVSQ